LRRWVTRSRAGRSPWKVRAKRCSRTSIAAPSGLIRIAVWNGRKAESGPSHGVRGGRRGGGAVAAGRHEERAALVLAADVQLAVAALVLQPAAALRAVDAVGAAAPAAALVPLDVAAGGLGEPLLWSTLGRGHGRTSPRRAEVPGEVGGAARRGR